MRRWPFIAKVLVDGLDRVPRIFVNWWMLVTIVLPSAVGISLCAVNQVDPARSPSLAITATLSPTPTITLIPTPPSTPTPTPSLTLSPTPSPTPTPTPTPVSVAANRTVAEVRNTLNSLKREALKRGRSHDKDEGLKVVVDDAILHGQFDIAFEAAKYGEYDKDQMLSRVARCIALEGEYQIARDVAGSIPSDYKRESVNEETFDLQYASMRGTPPPLCRKINWLSMPSSDQF